MSEPKLSEEDFKETLRHLVFSFSSATNLKELNHDKIQEAHAEIQRTLDEVSEMRRALNGVSPKVYKKFKGLSREVSEKPKGVSPKKYKLPKRMSRKEYRESMSMLMSMDHIFLCELCVVALKDHLKPLNSLTLPVVKRHLMERDPPPMNLDKMGRDVYTYIASERDGIKRMIETEKSKVRFLKLLKGKLKGKEKDNLKSQFFKRRRDLKASLVKQGMKNAECMLRAYELFTLKLPSKSGKLVRSQEEVANALVEEGLRDRCSQQTISRWNDLVKRELKG